MMRCLCLAKAHTKSLPLAARLSRGLCLIDRRGMRCQLLLLMSSILLLSGCREESVSELPLLEFMANEEIVNELGSPALTEEFTLGGSRGYSEYESGVAARYPLDDPATEGVVIRELRWSDGDFTTTAFLHKVGDTWKVLDAFRWSNETAF